MTPMVYVILYCSLTHSIHKWGRRGCDCMIVGFITSYAISVQPITFESRSWRGVFDTKLCDKVWQFFVAGWWFSLGIPVSSTNKLTATI